MSALGVFGGTFNPIHFGHLRTALELRDYLKIDEVRMVPCHLPSHRERPGVSSLHRMAMLECAVSQTQGLVADGRELDREGLSYTINTLNSFAAEFPGRDLALIVGVDAFSNFTQWYKWQDILTLCNLVVVNRPNSELSKSAQNLLDERKEPSYELCKGHVGHIIVCSLTHLDISSTKIRSYLAKGKEADFLIPFSVKRYIKKHALYLG